MRRALSPEDNGQGWRLGWSEGLKGGGDALSPPRARAHTHTHGTAAFWGFFFVCLRFYAEKAGGRGKVRRGEAEGRWWWGREGLASDNWSGAADLHSGPRTQDIEFQGLFVPRLTY